MDENQRILSHVVIGVEDLERSRVFYDAILTPLGCRRIQDMKFSTDWGKAVPELVIVSRLGRTRLGPRARPDSGLRVCLMAPDEDAVDEFYEAALDNGGICEEAPSIRPFDPGHYAVYVVDFDGNEIEARCLPGVYEENL